MSLEMKTISSVFQRIFKDNLATQLILLALAVCGVNFILSWSGLISLLSLLGAISLSVFTLQNFEARKTVQNALISFLNVQISSNSEEKDDNDKVSVELDDSVESFFRSIIKNFISSWYSNVSRDEVFVYNLKVEIAEAVRKIAVRVKKVDHAKLLSNKLLPVVYSHLDILSRINHAENSSNAIQAFIENENSIHPATFNRIAEINYLRQLSQQLLTRLISSRNNDSKVIVSLLKEVLTHAVLLPLMDVISDPGTINFLVILATSPKVQNTLKQPSGQRVILLENFVKKFELKIENSVDSGNFLKDQEKLYSFMQHLKTKSSKDIDLLKFYLDVEHLNSQLENENVISNPYKLSELQQKSEKLLIFYQENLNEKEETKPKDLVEAHEKARKSLEIKWKNDFYRSGEYFQLIYGDKEIYSVKKSPDQVDNSSPQKTFSLKLKNAMTIRTGTVEGIEATEIPIWDAMDHPLGSSSYYNSMAVKLRKERGQDLDNFMQSFFHSIEQDADVGEDIALTQDTNRRKRIPNPLGNSDLYKNLFNLPFSNNFTQLSLNSHVKTATDCLVYFFESILKLHEIFLKIARAVLQFLPDSEAIILKSTNKFIQKHLSESVLAALIKELEEKVLDSKPSTPASEEELKKREELAKNRLESYNKNLSKTLGHLQNPVLNKNLMYCLMDLVIVEIFPEFSLAKD